MTLSLDQLAEALLRGNLKGKPPDGVVAKQRRAVVGDAA